MSLADEFRSIGIGWVWGIAFFIVAVFGGILTRWEAIEHLITNQGLGEEGTNLLAFVAGYTLPLTAGFGVIAFLVLTGVGKQFHYGIQLVGAAVILWLAGEAARSLGLGLLPDYTGWVRISGHPYLRPLIIVLNAYFTTYGWALMICAFAIGCAIAFQIERWLHSDQ